MARSKSSAAWLSEHVHDHFVHRAKADGWRSRAVFKLMEIDEKDRLLRPGMVVVDLGAAPGGWCQYVAPRVGDTGRVIGLDLLEIVPIHGVEFIQGDFTEDATLAALNDTLAGRAVDLVLSDMAPNLSGVVSADQAKSVYLAELALAFAQDRLQPGGAFLVKVFHGSGFEPFRKAMQAVDSTILVGAVGIGGDQSGWSDFGDKVIDGAAASLDFYVVHDYGFTDAPTPGVK